MDALIPAFVVAALLELGDRTQLLVVALSDKYRSDKYRRPAPVLLGVALSAAVNCGVAAAGGAVLAGLAPHSAILLVTAIALVLGAIGGFFRSKPAPSLDGWKLGAFASSAGSLLILAFGDKTQFIVVALAAASGQPVLAGIGAAAGVIVANLPAALLGSEWPRLAPLRAIRLAVGIAITLAGLVLAANALGIA